ncbi:hypothetical protein [Myroides sp. LoEW2-1]|uniref:hypothetical protein n=1 Tax=Myroides sp. LoEW2-1 TaxID=2683192 RepID=UPI001329BF5A|nr:hypothetical protein [Myroides sp. LoEW2-1]MVX36335.1 hypothetical protein [Myroides sp. LoEW2-1]
MSLRSEIAPQMKVAEERYPIVLKAVLGYTDFCDEYGDDDLIEYKRVEEELHQLTGKDMSRYDLWEYWEGEGAEVLSFRIALPDPLVVKDISRQEITEIVTILKVFDVSEEIEGTTFKQQFKWHLSDYYYSFLKLNCPKYSNKFFMRNKNKLGEYFEYSIEETVNELMKK